jgi:hypothetical protein
MIAPDNILFNAPPHVKDAYAALNKHNILPSVTTNHSFPKISTKYLETKTDQEVNILLDNYRTYIKFLQEKELHKTMNYIYEKRQFIISGRKKLIQTKNERKIETEKELSNKLDVDILIKKIPDDVMKYIFEFCGPSIRLKLFEGRYPADVMKLSLSKLTLPTLKNLYYKAKYNQQYYIYRMDDYTRGTKTKTKYIDDIVTGMTNYQNAYTDVQILRAKECQRNHINNIEKRAIELRIIALVTMSTLENKIKAKAVVNAIKKKEAAKKKREDKKKELKQSIENNNQENLVIL